MRKRVDTHGTDSPIKSGAVVAGTDVAGTDVAGDVVSGVEGVVGEVPDNPILKMLSSGGNPISFTQIS